jgi:hypothetical protein
MGSTATKSVRKKRLFTAALALLAAAILAYFFFVYFRRFMALGYVDFAIGTLRDIHVAEAEYASKHPQQGYACEFSTIASQIPALRNSNSRNGYEFGIRFCGAEAPGEPNRRYWVIANPLHAALPAFCVDQSGLLKVGESGSIEDCMLRGQPLN